MTTKKNDNEKNIEDNDDQPLTFLDLLKSVLGAFVGIQSEKNHQRAFNKMKPIHVIICGVLLMLLFFGTVITITQILLANA